MIASGRTPHRPKRWTKEDGFWDKAPTGPGVTADGHLRLGTNREILSWPGIVPQVRTEGEEDEAQRFLKKEREDLRARVVRRKAKESQAKRGKKAREDQEFLERQQECQMVLQEDIWSEKEER